jgi:CTP synthase (UTP-ammonia lyase)
MDGPHCHWYGWSRLPNRREDEAVAIAIVGDRNPEYVTHKATDSAFADLDIETRWIPTPAVAEAPSRLADYDGVLISPGSPYASMEGALAAIQFAREHELPLLGTCGGFQHVLLEFARNVLGIDDAEHAETNPDADELVVIPLACSLVGQQHPVLIEPDTLAAELYRGTETVEPFFCSFGLNPRYRPALEQGGIRFSGFDQDGEARILELPEHPFFLATLYVPQAASTKASPHPVLTGFINACRIRRERGGSTPDVLVRATGG